METLREIGAALEVGDNVSDKDGSRRIEMRC